MHPLLDRARRAPNWLRALFAVALPFIAFGAAAQRSPATAAVFVAWLLATLWLHAPVFAFDGPLPFSSLGLHVSGDVHPWDDVVRVEPNGDRDLQAVLADGSTVRVRVKGGRTREDLRRALAEHRPDRIAF